MEHHITIDKEGNIEFVAKEELEFLTELGTTEKKRASHVEPVSFVLRVLFHSIRRLVDDGSSWAQMTRRWRCRWRVNLTLSNGPIFGSFTNRQEAIDAEVEWINQNIL